MIEELGYRWPRYIIMEPGVPVLNRKKLPFHLTGKSRTETPSNPTAMPDAR